MAYSKQEIENKRLAALEKIRSRTSLHLSTSDNDSFPNNIKTDGVGPLLPNNRHKPKFQPYERSSSHGSLSPSIQSHKVISGTMYLISENRFEVKPSDFSEQLINIFKTIPSKIYGNILFIYF